MIEHLVCQCNQVACPYPYHAAPLAWPDYQRVVGDSEPSTIVCTCNAPSLGPCEKHRGGQRQPRVAVAWQCPGCQRWKAPHVDECGCSDV